MQKNLFIAISFILLMVGCAGNDPLLRQQNKDTYCLKEVDLAYLTLLASKKATGETKKDLERQAFMILKRAEAIQCTSSYSFLSLHYQYGIGTKRSLRDAEYYKKMGDHFANTDTEERLEYQGTDIVNPKDGK
jgi:hypothetical protein